MGKTTPRSATVALTAARPRPGNSRCRAWCCGLLLALFTGGAHALTCISAATVNNWNAVGTWSCGRVPANGDDVVISAGGATTLNVNSASLASLTVNGTLTIGNNTTARTLTVTGNTTVSGIMQVNNPAAATTHTLILGGDVSNTGTFNMSTARGKGNITFNNNGNQTVSGAGAYTFNRITLNMGATRANILDMQSAMTAPAGFLTINNGTYKHSNASNITPWNADPNIPASGGFWLNGAATVSTGSFNVTLNGGSLRISAGTMNIGATNNQFLRLNNVATTLFQMDGGVLNATGGIHSSSTAGAGTFTQTGGTITMSTVSPGPSETFMLGSATTFNMSGGSLVLQIANNAADDLNIRSGTQNVTGGTIQIGNASLTGTNPFLITNTTGAALNLWNLVLYTTGSPTTWIGTTVNILNDVTIQTGATLLDNNPSAGTVSPINIGAGNNTGNWTNDGTFTATAGDPNATVTFTGTSATQAIGGASATTFNNLTINKASNNLTINTTPTVGGTLTFTSGKIVTGANRVILDTTATIATPSATSYVVGAIQKNYNAGDALSYAANDFPVGDAANFTPVDVTAGTTSTAGSLTVTTTSTEHPQVTTPIPSTGIDANKDIARYWTLNNSGLTLSANISATVTFVAGDVDVGANTANFIVERYDGTNWNPTTLVAANATNTQASNITLAAGNNDFAVGEPLFGFNAVPGRFNAFETGTPANSLLGKIQTKVVGTAFSLDIVSINAAKTGYGGAVANVTVQLLDSSNNSGALDANDCRPTWTAVQTITTTLNIPAGGRVTLAGITVNQAYRDARLMMSAGGNIGCSDDRFSIRPTSITLSATDNDWQTAGTGRALNNSGASGGNVHKAGQLFTLTVSPQPASATNYDGTVFAFTAGYPACTAPPAACATGTLTPGAFSAAGSGVQQSNTASYTEAGVVNLQLEDDQFAAVDAVDGTPATCSNSAPIGRNLCSTATLTIGRFVPDHFDVSTANTPQFQTFGSACATRSFTYIGQPFGYATPYLATVTARNSGGATTTDYKGTGAGGLWKVTGSGITQTYGNNAVGPALDTSLIGTPAVTDNGNGTGTVTPAGTDKLAYQRSTTTPIPAVNNPFTANISLSVSAQDASENGPSQGIITSSTTALFNGGGTGIAFDSGAAFRFGRLRLANANGSELLDLPISIQAQYWNGTGFVTNTGDNCTVIGASNIKLQNYQPAGFSANMPQANVNIGGAFVSGVGNLKLAKPSPTAKGNVDLCVDLDVAAGSGDTTCQAATPANKTYLQGAWTGTGYTQDPVSRDVFGIYKGATDIIYMRENY